MLPVMRAKPLNNSTMLAFIWGLAEATLFFLVPDILFTYLAINNPRGAVKASLYALLGAMIGAVVVFLIMIGVGLLFFGEPTQVESRPEIEEGDKTILRIKVPTELYKRLKSVAVGGDTQALFHDLVKIGMLYIQDDIIILSNDDDQTEVIFESIVKEQ